jgi:hypothetical protein
VHQCWAGGAAGGTGGWASGHRGVVEELVDRAVALERTARLGSGWRLQAELLALQLPTIADKRERGMDGASGCSDDGEQRLAQKGG